MKVQTIKFVFAGFAALLFLNISRLGEILKPGEIIYSRQPGIINAPPRDANSPTIWAVGQDGSNDRQITTGTHRAFLTTGVLCSSNVLPGIRHSTRLAATRMFLCVSWNRAGNAYLCF